MEGDVGRRLWNEHAPRSHRKRQRRHRLHPSFHHLRALHDHDQSDITELRTALDAARTALDLPDISYTDSTINTSTNVRAAHFSELRAGTQ